MNPNTVQAIIFDLSGTVIDFGSRGPVVAFVELFRRHGIPVSEEVARLPMGSRKWDHIWSVLNHPEVTHLWTAAHGHPPSPADVDAMYPEFTALQLETLVNHCEVLPGIPQLCEHLSRLNIRYASTTGFESAMLPPVIASASAGGFHPEIFMTPDLVGGGRPAPWMIHHAAKHMGLYPLHTFVKVGDTPIDIAEAQAAGCWAVSVVATGNEIGLSQAALNALDEQDRNQRFQAATDKFRSLGAHYVIDAAANLPDVIDDINRRLSNGERP
jgi:phosphonoacetaldehyde hydrolase